MNPIITCLIILPLLVDTFSVNVFSPHHLYCSISFYFRHCVTFCRTFEWCILSIYKFSLVLLSHTFVIFVTHLSIRCINNGYHNHTCVSIVFFELWSLCIRSFLINLHNNEFVSCVSNSRKTWWAEYYAVPFDWELCALYCFLVYKLPYKMSVGRSLPNTFLIIHETCHVI